MLFTFKGHIGRRSSPMSSRLRRTVQDKSLYYPVGPPHRPVITMGPLRLRLTHLQARDQNPTPLEPLGTSVSPRLEMSRRQDQIFIMRYLHITGLNPNQYVTVNEDPSTHGAFFNIDSIRNWQFAINDINGLFTITAWDVTQNPIEDDKDRIHRRENGLSNRNL
jgi:hypothetical protein